MSKSLTLFSDKSETLKFKLQVEGVSMDNTQARLCLEFDEGQNLYFKGKVYSDGSCSISVPPLKMYEGKGNAIIECIADTTFFNLHSTPFEIKKKVNVIIKENFFEEHIDEDEKPKVTFKMINETVGEDDDIEDEQEIEEFNDDNSEDDAPVEKKIKKRISKNEGKMITFNDIFED